MTELYLLAYLAGQSIALSASDVEAVVDIDTVTPVPRVARHVIGLAAVRSRIVTLVDGAIAIGEAPLPPEGRAIVTIIDGHRYAIRVDSVDDVVPLESAVRVDVTQLQAGWRDCVVGRLQLGDRFVLLMDPARMIEARTIVSAPAAAKTLTDNTSIAASGSVAQ